MIISQSVYPELPKAQNDGNEYIISILNAARKGAMMGILNQIIN